MPSKIENWILKIKFYVHLYEAFLFMYVQALGSNKVEVFLNLVRGLIISINAKNSYFGGYIFHI